MNATVPNQAISALIPTSMDGALRLADMMAHGKLVPDHLHNSPGDCLMVVEQAMRWGMSPFAVAQCTSVIGKKLMFEGKLVVAALNASGILASRLEYDFSGSGGGRTITVRGTLRGETKPREVVVALADVKTSNAFWTKQPDQQLVYAGTRVWARRHAPEVMLGVYSPEEFETPAVAFSGHTIDAVRDDVESSTRDAINAAVPLVEAEPPPKRTVKEWLAEVSRDLEAAPDLAAVEKVIARPEVQRALAALTNGALAQLRELIDRARQARMPVGGGVMPGDATLQCDAGDERN